MLPATGQAGESRSYGIREIGIENSQQSLVLTIVALVLDDQGLCEDLDFHVHLLSVDCDTKSW